MRSPLQEKDRRWRRRGHASRPIFDPGLAPPGADAEAGGAPSEPPAPEGPTEPLPLNFDRGHPGLRLAPGFWRGVLVLIGLALIAAALATFN
jgi:hypothetical protein